MNFWSIFTILGIGQILTHSNRFHHNDSDSDDKFVTDFQLKFDSITIYFEILVQVDLTGGSDPAVSPGLILVLGTCYVTVYATSLTEQSPNIYRGNGECNCVQI